MGEKIISTNKRARYDYHILDTYDCGIVLTGTEIKSLRIDGISINEAYIIVKNDEVFLLNAHIAPFKEGNIFNHDPRRTRKLLLHKSEIFKLKRAVNEKSLTIVPLKVYLKKGIAKIEIALARGKKNYDKRETIKARDDKREMERLRKDFNKRS